MSSPLRASAAASAACAAARGARAASFTASPLNCLVEAEIARTFSRDASASARAASSDFWSVAAWASRRAPLARFSRASSETAPTDARTFAAASPAAFRNVAPPANAAAAVHGLLRLVECLYAEGHPLLHQL